MLSASTEPENDLRFNTVFEVDIGFLLEIDHFSCDEIDTILYPIGSSMITSP